jgi:hypothetical protein
MLTGTGELETVLDATEYSSTNHVIALVNGKDLTLRNISLLGNEQLLGIRCGSTTIVNNLEVTDCKFDGFKTPIYLNEKYDDNATDAHNKVGTLIIERNEFVNIADIGHAAYIGRGVVNYASIRDNSVTGGRRGFQIFDCSDEVGTKELRTTGQLTIANNTFEGIVQWPIDLMIGGQVTITGNNVIADLDEVEEVWAIVLRDTDSGVVQDFSGNKVNGSAVSLEQRDFIAYYRKYSQYYAIICRKKKEYYR